MFHTQDQPASQGSSRRTFLRATAAGTVGLALAGQSQAHAATKSANAPPAWFDQDKFGIFVHWNAAAIPAYAPVHTADLDAALSPDAPKWRQEQQWRLLPYAEMYQNTMNVPGSETARFHRERYPGTSYDDFVAQFRDRSLAGWNPRPWADLFAKSGAKYVVVTTKTEDGFLLWPSKNPNPHKRNWQAKRDVLGEFATAVRRKGMRFGTYYSTGMDWTFGGLPIVDNESFAAALVSVDLDYTGKHWQELIDRYQPSVL
ncbi:alpha-L-fucosidase [Tenggerimyces flavus]|uniref:alpha-L-fucosidase n=1 Tax=Tenggerimyces flavus TaxID=1708749 RepID=A0ABV7Y7L7_9ACTN|nr:alpha-L-fucosidase [Tenggerimyces flavus]MBM7785064.1 alpha-L-fucosidase [Tenggerimyces flavus]